MLYQLASFRKVYLQFLLQKTHLKYSFMNVNVIKRMNENLVLQNKDFYKLELKKK